MRDVLRKNFQVIGTDWIEYEREGRVQDFLSWQIGWRMIPLTRQGAYLERRLLCFRHNELRLTKTSNKKLDPWVWSMGTRPRMETQIWISSKGKFWG